MTTAEEPTLTLVTLDQWASLPRGRGVARLELRFAFSDVLSLGDQLSDLVRTDKRRAHRLAAAFVQLMQAVGRESDLAVARRCRAHTLRHLHRMGEALRDYEAAQRGFERCGLEVEAARTSIGAIGALALLGRYREAIHLGRGARAVFERAGEIRRAARLDVNIASLLELLERHGAALARYQAAERVFESLDERVDLALTRFNRARVLVAMDRYREGMEVYRSSAAVWEERGMTASLVQCRLELGNVLFRLGRLTEALDILERANDAAVTLEDRALESTALLERARVELLVNRTRDAGAHLDQAIAGFVALGIHLDHASALMLRAMVHLHDGGANEAIACLDEAAALCARARNRPRRWWVRLRRALVLRDVGRGAIARSELRQCIVAFRRYRQRGLEAEARLALAENLIESGRRGTGSVLAGAVPLVRELGDPWLEYRGARVQACRLVAERRSGPARIALERAYRLALELRGALPLEADRAFFLSDKNDLSELALRLASITAAQRSRVSAKAGGRVRSGALAAARWAFLWSERGHVPRLRDTWSARRSIGEGSEIEAAARRALDEAREEVHWLDEQERARMKSAIERAPAPTSASLARRRSRRRAATGRLDRLFRRLEMQTALRLGLPRQVEPSPRRIQRALAADEALIEYFVGTRALHAFSIGARHLVHLELPTPVLKLRDRVHRLRRVWDRFRLGGAFTERHRAALERTVDDSMGDLERALWKPVISTLPATTSRLVVVPHRWLHGVPFHAFESPTARLRYALSGHGLVDPPRAGRAQGPALAIGCPSIEAPSAGVEAAEVARLLGDCDLLIGEHASPEAVRSAWSRARVIHVAAHAGVRTDDARLSGLALSGGSWTVYDLYSNPTRADLVVLSACQTGESVLWGSDDAVGLLPGLFQTGARAAIVSLWPVDDRITLETMKRLHEHLSAGRSPGDALKSSQAAIRATHPSPYFWAPFALYGTDPSGERP